MDPAKFDAIQSLLDKMAEVAEQQLSRRNSFRFLRTSAKSSGEGLSFRSTSPWTYAMRQKKIRFLSLRRGFRLTMGKLPTASGAILHRNGMWLTKESGLCPMTDAQNAGTSGTSSSKIPPALIVGQRWAKTASCSSTQTNARGAKKGK